jgi:predicted nucleic-acid-binding Zn-ribbon protein
MWVKFKLMCWIFLGAWLGTTSAQTIKQLNPSPRLLIIGSYFSGYFGGKTEERYQVLRSFIVNYSNDTLRFWGTNCRPTEFFTITNNDYMHLAAEECNNSVFEQLVIPPHRSLLVPLKMLIEKQPHEIIRLKVSMKFYRWFSSGHFVEDRKYHQPEILTDTITLNFDKGGNSYYGNADWKEQERREKLNLPTTALHLLTDIERKLYTVTADETKIGKSAEGKYSYNNEKVFRIPITVHNNSNETLTYYSMSCSWQEFYHIDNKNLGVMISPCDSNFPIKVIVPAHSAHIDMVPFVRKKNNLNTPESFRVGLNINKNIEESMFGGYNEELRIYKLVWSNEAKFISK